MDAQAKKKALFRAKLNAQKKEKRIESPLVRYNEFDQPVCRVCEVVLKSESLWDAHQVSRKHREAISNLKANAAGLTKQNNAKPDIPKAKPEQSSSSQFKIPQSPQEVPKPQSSSVLPPDFFDNNDAQKTRYVALSQCVCFYTYTFRLTLEKGHGLLQAGHAARAPLQ
ncbi:zinc finger protein, partial [Trifolium pratense]